MENKNYKLYKLESKHDFIHYLRFLIVTAHKQVLQYRKYINELKKTIEELDLNSDEVKFFNGEIYDEFRDKLGFVSLGLLNIFADETNTAASYKKLRKIIDRKKDIDFGLSDLSDDIQSIISQFNNGRNWSAHMPESIIHAQLEVLEKNKGSEITNKLINNYNPITAYLYKRYDKKWLFSLLDQSSQNYEGFRRVLQQMKKDYSVLIGKSMELVTNHQDIRLFDEDFEIPSLSMEMQNKKYKRN
ncbi:hypothetical protein [Paenibacillus sp. PK1-4R]|uniref:hypothetical protein n=1 Tax=Paenibacillus sp. PK1-4R TaxID=3049075 RepID=UPI0025A050D0|nr:hypothetical protein [Paenibacillus sp. PK1-4R]WJM09795.1 hypothetical protein QNO02_07680 [Paenibacillus sp. PK1-4R]